MSIAPIEVGRSPARRPRRCWPPLLVLVASLSGLIAPASHAQELRATIIARQQAEKAGKLTKYVPSRAESAVVRLKTGYLSTPSGFYPMFGTVYSGGGMAAGAGYRGYYGDNTFFDVKGLYSIRNYKWIELSTDSIGHALNRLGLHARAGWRDATQVAFYGVGIASSNDNRTSFRLQNLYTGIDADFKPAAPVILRAGLGYEDYTIEDGQGRRPSIATQFEPSVVPGLFADPSFVHAWASAGIDWRPSPGYARSGGLYEVRYRQYRDPDDVYSFDRLEGEIVQHLPILREKYVLSVRGRVETVLDEEDLVPFFMLSSLGSGSTLRGFSSWRFRDRHSLLMQAEWRWPVNRVGLDMALFYDAGKVASRRADLDLDGLKSDVGLGVRFHGPAATPLRIELARSNEGLRLVFAGSTAF
jgi:hypothetical protein